MTTIIAPSGEAIGCTFLKPEQYAEDARRQGWIATVVGDKVYVRSHREEQVAKEKGRP